MPLKPEDDARSGVACDVAGRGYPRPGDVIAGRVRLVRVLGQGAMGIVYEAEQIELRRRVAVKLIRPEALASKTALQRFFREARACARVSHPNVIDVYDVFEDDGAACIVMPMLRGESLGARLEREGSLAIQAAVRVTAAVLSGLHAAHEVGVVHRDVKPDNVFLVEADAEPSVRVLDFGIAHLADPTDGAVTREGSLLGTPSYMSPEQAVGALGIDRRADVYSVGAMLYHLLSGARPFSGESVVAVLAAVVRGACEPLARRRPDLPPALVAIVERAMAFDRDARFATASAFEEALVAFGRGEAHPESALRSAVIEPVTAAPRTTRSLRARRLGALAALGAVSTLVGVALVTARSPRSAGSTSTTSVARTVTAAVTAPPSQGPPTVGAPVDGGARVDASSAAVSMRLVTVLTEDGTVVTAPGTSARAVARIERAGENARARLRVPVDAVWVRCAIPFEQRPVRAPIRVDGEGEGHAECSAP